jgi:hypothetical protein
MDDRSPRFTDELSGRRIDDRSPRSMLEPASSSNLPISAARAGLKGMLVTTADEDAALGELWVADAGRVVEQSDVDAVGRVALKTRVEFACAVAYTVSATTTTTTGGYSEVGIEKGEVMVAELAGRQ